MVTTKTVDGDIALDFDESNRLAGIEILGASKRLDLHDLFPVEMTNFANGHEFGLHNGLHQRKGKRSERTSAALVDFANGPLKVIGES